MTLATRTRAPSLARAELDTGLTVVAVRKPRSPLVEVRLRVPFAGTTPLHSARAEMLVATMLLGTSSRDREQVDADLALVGGHLDASVDPQRLMITGSVLSTGLPVLLEVLADCLTDPAYRRTTSSVSASGWSSTWPSRRPSRPPSPTSSCSSAGSATTRPPGTCRRRNWSPVSGRPRCAGCTAGPWCPRGSTLVLVGDLSPTKAIAAAGAALAGWSAGPGCQGAHADRATGDRR